ncbi:MAG: T9SS type A sorting domain-containing protein, partial [Ignavibacteriales bacterium]|nr:T9SS type A sorting domain-containing protein [Ignavibacteriales bacterium]
HYPQHTTVDCISCHFTGFSRSKGQNAHDVWRYPERDNRVRPLVMKYNEAINWYPHNIVKPDSQSLCASKCHYTGNLIGASTINSVQISSEVPGSFSLQQNFPNPFNPTTEIKYQLPHKAHVHIAIYNTIGVEIAILVNSEQEPGYYVASWDGTNNSGQPVSSGLYMYKMETGSFTGVKKMLYLK